MKKGEKDLITDILKYLQKNEKGRKRFNSYSFFEYDDYEKEFLVEVDDFYNRYSGWRELESKQQIPILLTALSSPDNKPICEFLAGENLISKAKTISSALYRFVCDSIEKGQKFEEFNVELNKLYNELCPDNQ